MSARPSEPDARYARQIALPEIGEAGQARLRQARVLIVGVGGLGSPVSLYLAGADVGHLGLMDADVVSVSNLQRQILYTEAEVGRLKVDCAARRLHALNADAHIETYPFRLDRENAAGLIARYDMVADGCDNFATRYVLSDVCAALHIPYIYGAIQGFEGQVSVFCHGSRPKTYRDLYPDEAAMSRIAADPSVIGVTPGIVGCAIANEALKLLTGYGHPLSGKLWTIDLRTMETYTLDI